jgi:DNA polymerase-4
MTARLIMHLDMDAFFAAIEQRDRPELRGRPVVIGAQPGRRGVVATCSYEARKFGVHSAMPIARAYKLCPQAVYLIPDHRRYADESEKVMAILERLSPIVEPCSIDEAFVDITGLERLFGAPAEIGRRAKATIAGELGLTASVGIGPNRQIAKIASDFRKPDGLTVVPPEGVLDFLAPLPVGRLRGVGPRLREELGKLGLRTVADLRAWPSAALTQRFGASCGEWLHRQARGQSSDEVGGDEGRKQISKETTFDADVADADVLRDTLLELAADIGRQARSEDLRGVTVTLKIRFPPFETHTRQKTLPHAIDSDRQIFGAAQSLFAENGFAGRPVRLIGVGLSDWEVDCGGQMDLGFVTDERETRLFAAVDRIKEKYGRRAIGLGAAGAKKTDDDD